MYTLKGDEHAFTPLKNHAKVYHYYANFMDFYWLAAI
jgi:hypothetical protein